MATLKQQEDLYLKAKDAYYEGKPIMSDAQFDILEEKLKASGSTVIKLVGSKKAGKVTHPSAMLSLGKIAVKDEDNMNLYISEVTKWMNAATANGSKRFEISSKFDGSAINLIYKNGKLVSALTRGDGEKGFDIKDKMIHLVPATIPFDGKMEIRGEVVIEKKVFEKKYSVEALGEDGFANARNFVAGKLSTDEINLPIIKDLNPVLYEVRIHQGNSYFYPTKVDTMTLLTKLGFNKKFPVYLEYMDRPSDFLTLYKKFKYYRENISPFLLDGMVIKASENCRSNMGYTDHHPKWAIAIKFPPKEAETEIVDIDWKTGSSGEVVPTAIMKPIDLDGSTVRRATLFNKGKIDEMGAWPGARVLIAKAGDIIPQIYEVVKKSKIPGKIPTHCPTCGEELHEDDVHLWCLNSTCEAQVLSKLEGGIRVFKIQNIGGSTIKKLYAAGIKRVEDFFDKKKFNKSNLIRSGQFVDGRALDIVLDAVNEVDNVDIAHVIQSMKITDVGEAVSKQVAKKMSDLEFDVSGLNREAWKEVTDPTKKGYQRLQEYLVLLRENFIEVNYEQDTSSLKTFEMTGSPPTAGKFKTKSDYSNYFKRYGYVHDKLTVETNYLLTDSMDSTTGKMVKAEELRKKGSKVVTITYQDFIEKIIGYKNFFENKDKKDKEDKQMALF